MGGYSLMEDLGSIVLVILIGGLVGFLSGFLGVGGGFILVPLLIFTGIPTHTAIGSSLAYIVFTAISGLIQHRRQRNLDLKLALLVSCSSVVTAQIGAITTLYIEARYLELLLAIMLLGTAVRMIIQRDIGEYGGGYNGIEASTGRGVVIAASIGLLTGFLSGLLGVGGGFLLVPLLVIVLHTPIHTAIGTSLMAVIGSAASGAIRHWMIGNVDLALAVILSVGGVAAAPLGAKACRKFSQKQLRRIFSAVLIVLAFKLLAST
jgi:uncharacterized membrane protein YfcA